MTPAPQQLADAEPAALGAAGAACDALAGLLTERADALTGARAATGGQWSGIAASLADLALSAERGRCAAAGERFRGLASLLVQAGEELRPLRAELRAVLTEARTAGCTVHEDGSISAPAGAPHPAAPHPAAAPALAARLAAVLAAAERLDAHYAAAFARAAEAARSGDALDPRAARTALQEVSALVAATLPAPGSSPAAVHDWWLHLGPDERRMLVRDQPRLVGCLDGVPAAARDAANRVLLARLLDSTDDPELLRGLQSISDRLARQRGAAPPLLLSLGTEGQGRAVLSFGDPDRADHVSVYVPGMGTRLADVGGKDGDRALAVHDAAVAAAPGARPGAAASMVWLGYDAPLSLPDGARATRAEQGAASYDRFLEGLRATHQGAPPHLVALGHSYGSLLVGRASQQPGGLPADDVVLIGSPGTGLSRAADLGLAPGRVWAGSASQDPVSRHLPAPGVLLAEEAAAAVSPALLGPAMLLTERPGGTWFGVDPAAPAFGARPLPTDGGPGPGGGFASAHSHYLDPGSSSLAAVGRIVSGRM